MSKQKVASPFESMFTTHQTFRRNKHYYNALKINRQQHHTEQYRRKPITGQTSPLGSKIQNVFQSAKKERQGKVDEDITRFKFRLSYYNKEENPENQLLPYSQTCKEDNPKNFSKEASPKNFSKEAIPKKLSKIKGVPIQKMQSRQTLNGLNFKPCLDQRQFNNFYITQNDLSKTPKIENYSPRNLNIALEHMHDIYYNSQEAYEKLYFERTTNSCLFNLKKQNDEKARYFFIPQRQENLPATEMKPQNVAKSFSVATPFKSNKIMHFYKINGRQLPTTFDQRFSSPNRNFYKNSEGKLVKKDVSFTARRYKDQLLARDLQEIKKSKKPYFNRDQICDERYFKQEKRYM